MPQARVSCTFEEIRHYLYTISINLPKFTFISVFNSTELIRKKLKYGFKTHDNKIYVERKSFLGTVVEFLTAIKTDYNDAITLRNCYQNLYGKFAFCAQNHVARCF